MVHKSKQQNIKRFFYQTETSTVPSGTCEFSVRDSGTQDIKVEKRWFTEHTVGNNTMTMNVEWSGVSESS